ncbi:MAG TPA: hypothetical protein VFH80_29230 [Solirubrobacteraceae bacterium]|nr:hypothetical protein [Solirubrobacteraceae bacterium]
MQRKRIRLAGTLVVLLVLLGVAATLAIGAPRAHQARAALVVTKRNPLTVRGTGFKPNTRARVTLLAAQKQVRRPLANSRGAFTATFSSVVIDHCSGWTVTASQPGRATVILHGPKPECPPA